MVFVWAADQVGADISITLADDQISILAPVVDSLQYLSRISTSLCCQAADFFTRPRYRWMFISNDQPHRYLLRAFHDQITADIRSKNHRVCLNHVALRNLLEPSLPGTSFAEYCMLGSYSGSSYASRYIRRIDPQLRADDHKLLNSMRLDVNIGLVLLARVLP